MSDYYKGKRSRNIFDPLSPEPFRVSRTKIDAFLNCPRCFYIDRRLGVGQPPGYPFSLNSAVDHLLKKEFDVHRVDGTAHPLMKEYGIEAVPFVHELMDNWRENFVGVQYLHPQTNLIITGAVDDVWVNPQGELIVVDYKSTAKTGEVSLDADWQIGYKRQMEVYQWLLRNNGFTVSDTGYFVYCNGDIDKEAFDGKLEFKVKLLPYTGDASWIDETIIKLKDCLVSDQIPPMTADCDYCTYNSEIAKIGK